MLIFIFIAIASATPYHNYMIPYMLAKDENSNLVDSNMALMLMMAQNAHHARNG